MGVANCPSLHGKGKPKTVLTPKMDSKRCSFTLFVAIVAFCSISAVRGDDWSEDELDFTVDKSEARFLNFNNTGLPDARAILAFTLLGLLALVTFGPALLGAFGGGSGSGNQYGYNRNGFDYYDGAYQGYGEDGTQTDGQFYARSNADDIVTKM